MNTLNAGDLKKFDLCGYSSKPSRKGFVFDNLSILASLRLCVRIKYVSASQPHRSKKFRKSNRPKTTVGSANRVFVASEKKYAKDKKYRREGSPTKVYRKTKMATEGNKNPLSDLMDKLRSALSPGDRPKKKVPGRDKTRFNIWYFVLAVLFISYLQPFFFSSKVQKVPYSQFKQYIAEGKVAELTIGPENIEGTLTGSTGAAFTTVRVDDPDLVKELDERKVNYSGRYENKFLTGLLSWVIPLGIFFLIWRMAMKKMGAGMGVMSFSKSKAKIFAESETKVSFEDAAGIDEAKEELREVVEFLRSPEKSRKLGGRIPKGVLLVGPPGTGKTLLARAVAGEAKAPFFSISGSEFVEMFVGVGAARVRDLFSQAATQAPCIIFIDELDALGKARGMNVMGGHDEREQTLNQLLVEMDGFETNKGVIIMAATNRPEILDPALLRPGRFDRQVLVDRPDINGREAILKIHAKNVVLGPQVDLRQIAGRTPGFVGADLANIINEAALLAARNDKETVESTDFDEAIDRVVAGLQKKKPCDERSRERNRRLPRVRTCDRGRVRRTCRPSAQNLHYSPRDCGARIHPAATYGRPLPDDPFGIDRPTGSSFGWQGGRRTGFRRNLHRRPERLAKGHGHRPVHGDGIRHERSPRAGELRAPSPAYVSPGKFFFR